MSHLNDQLEPIEKTVYYKGLDDPDSYFHATWADTGVGSVAIALCGHKRTITHAVGTKPARVNYCPTCLMKSGGRW